MIASKDKQTPVKALRPRRVAIAVGGTAGHVHAALAIAEAYREVCGAQVFLIGPRHTRDLPAVTGSGFPFSVVATGPFSRQSFIGKLRGLGQNLYGLVQARRLLQKQRIEIAIGCGGFASVPIALGARSLGIPFVLHEANAAAGLANKVLDRFAARVCLGLDEAQRCFHSPRTVTGNPILRRRRLYASAESQRDLPTPAKILILGGSGGSPFLNREVPALMMRLRARGIDFEVLHQVGVDDESTVAAAYAASGITHRVVGQLEPIEEAYNDAHFAISCAGAITLAELEAFALPAILIPLGEAAWAHQNRNAAIFAQRNGSRWWTEEAWDEVAICNFIADLLGDPSRWRVEHARLHRLAQTDASSAIVRACEELFHPQKRPRRVSDASQNLSAAIAGKQ